MPELLKKPAPEPPRWYAVKTFYRRLFPVRDAAAAKGMKPYVAMTVVEEVHHGKLVKVEQPLISALLFVYCTETELYGFKKEHESECMFYQDFATRRPAPIDDTEMRSFIILTAPDHKTCVEYLGESVPDFKRGERVRVIDGPLKGAEGYIKKIKSDRKFIVEIKGVAVIAVSYINPAFLEKI